MATSNEDIIKMIKAKLDEKNEVIKEQQIQIQEQGEKIAELELELEEVKKNQLDQDALVKKLSEVLE